MAEVRPGGVDDTSAPAPEPEETDLQRAVEAIDDGGPADWATDLARTSDGNQAIPRLQRLAAVVAAHRQWMKEPSETPAAPVESSPKFDWGHLRVFEKLGEGSFAEVYRAWDPRLGREVALKVRRVGSGARAARRWLNEARRLARVRHPNVLVVHGVDEHDGRVGIWTEFLRGRTLEDRLAREGPMGAREAALIGTDLCSALAAVHAAGLVHGDVKTTNIMREGAVLPGASRATSQTPIDRVEAGRIVLMDFGSSRESPTSDDMAGTAAYGTPLFSAPEVLQERRPSASSDLYSLGVVLYRLVTAKYPIAGSTVDELRAASRSGSAVPLRAVRPDLPAAFVQVVERALAVEVADRYGSAAEMERALAATLSPGTVTQTPSRRRSQPRILVIGAMAAVAIASGIAWRLRSPSPGPGAVEFQIPVSALNQMVIYPSNVAVSPDGKTVAYVTFDEEGMSRLTLRPLGSVNSRTLPGTEGAAWPFWSPDSRFLGFFCPTEGKLKRVSASGGLPVALCQVKDGRGACWLRGTILFAPKIDGPLFRIPAEGGEISVATALDLRRGEFSHRFPVPLPDGRHFLFAVLPGGRDGWDIFAGSLGSRQVKKVMTAGSTPVYGAPGYLLFARDGKVMAQRFDAARLRTTGEAVPIADEPDPTGMDAEPAVTVSRNGVLALPSTSSAVSQLVWFDRSGARQEVAATLEGRYDDFYLSPDGLYASVVRNETNLASSVWVVDLKRGVSTRLSPRGVRDEFPVWSPDQSRIAFSSNRSAPMEIWVQGVGSGTADSLASSNDLFKYPTDWSRDGRWLAFTSISRESRDIWSLSLTDGKAVPYARSPFDEDDPRFSPDGAWLAYRSAESGHDEIYVQSFPVPSRKTRVTTGGAIAQRWVRGGRELIYRSGNGRTMMAVSIETGDEVRLGTPQRLFQLPPDAMLSNYAVTRDGERFLVMVSAGEAARRSLRVIVGWTALLN